MQALQAMLDSGRPTSWKFQLSEVSFLFGPVGGICNLRFVDDVLTVAPTWHQTRQMLADIKQASGSVGLAPHPDKTNMFMNAYGESADQQIPKYEYFMFQLRCWRGVRRSSTWAESSMRLPKRSRTCQSNQEGLGRFCVTQA